MVTFICSNCNSSLKKSQVQVHGCNGKFACVTCNSDFTKSTFKTHDRCITEAEKYQGSDYKAKVNKGEIRQEEWTNTVHDALNKYHSTNPNLTKVVNELKNKINFPKTAAKFKNFMNTVCGVRTVQNCAGIIWDVIAAHKESLRLSNIVNGNSHKKEAEVKNESNNKRKNDDILSDADVKKVKLEDISESKEKKSTKSAEIANEVEVPEIKVEKKKKKKTKEIVEESCSIVVLAEEKRKIKKEKKEKKMAELIETNEVLTEASKKKKKDKKKTEEVETNTVEPMEVDFVVDETEKKKKKNKKSKIAEVTLEESPVVDDSKKKDKKKKKSKKRPEEATMEQ